MLEVDIAQLRQVMEIRRIRSMAELARRSGLTERTLMRLTSEREGEASRFTLRSLDALCQALRVEPWAITRFAFDPEVGDPPDGWPAPPCG